MSGSDETADNQSANQGYPGPEAGDSVAGEPQRTVPKGKALKGVQDPVELIGGPPGDDGQARDLQQVATHFLVFHPFFTYFVHLATRQSADGRKKVETIVADFRASNGGLYRFCVGADLTLMVLVAALAVAAAGYSAFKTIVL